MKTVYELYSKYLPCKVSTTEYRKLKLWVAQYEVRVPRGQNGKAGGHAMALNTPFLGLDRLVFHDGDIEDVCNIFGFDHDDIKQPVKTNIATKIQNPKPDEKWYFQPRKFKVAHHYFYWFIVWCMHKTHTSSSLNRSDKDDMMFLLGKLMFYRFFSSLTYQRFQYDPDPEVMRAAMLKLSGSFEIVKRGTWKNLIEHRIRVMMDKDTLDGRYQKVFATFSPREGVQGMIAAAQSGLRPILNRVTRLFYEAHNNNERVVSEAATNTVNGEKILRERLSSLDTTLSYTVQMMSNTRTAVNFELVNLVCAQNHNIRKDILIRIINAFVDELSYQQRSGTAGAIRLLREKPPVYRYDGNVAFIKKLIAAMFRQFLLDGVDVRNKSLVFKKTLDVLRSSQLKDRDISDLKDTSEEKIVSYDIVSRAPTIVAAKVNLMVYIMLVACDSF